MTVVATVTALTEDAPAKTALVWTSSDPTVVKAANGKITGVHAGSATVTVSAKDDETIQASFPVTVVSYVTGITVSNKSVKINMYDTVSLTATVKPADATNPGIVWSSSDPEIASVDENGTVSGVKDGDCVVTCSSVDGSGKSASVKVHVDKVLVSVDGENCELFSKNGVTIWWCGTYKKSGLWIAADVVVKNDNDYDIGVSFGGKVNGWSIGKNNGFINSPNCGAHSQLKAQIALDKGDIGDIEVDELKNMDLEFVIHKDNRFGKKLFKVETGNVTLHYNFGGEDTSVTNEYTEEELANSILSKDGEDCLLFTKDGVSVWLCGTYEEAGSMWLAADVVIENQNDYDVSIKYDGSANGWALGRASKLVNSPTCKAHSKLKGQMGFDYDKIGNISIKELKTLNLEITVYKETDEEEELFTVNTGNIILHVK